jgi:collagenase-like PrtC family protease
LNKRDNEKAQITIDEAQSFLKLREKYSGIRFFVALNEAPITWDDKKIKEKLSQLLSLIDPDAFIVRDLSVINALKEIKKDVKLHISSLAQVWNEDAISFFVDFL